MYRLRQKTYGIFIRPYIVYADDNIPFRGMAERLHPCQNPNLPYPQYAPLQGGSVWMLYNDETFTSFSIAKEKVREVMDTLGYSKNDIKITEIIPMDYIVTPFV